MSGDGDTYDIELEYDDVAAVAEAIGPEVTLLGHSYGGPIAIGAATRTDAIARVIAYEGWPSLSGSPPAYAIGDATERIQTLLDSDDRDGAVTLVFRDVVGLDECSSRRCEHSRFGMPGSLRQAPCRGNCGPTRPSK